MLPLSASQHRGQEEVKDGEAKGGDFLHGKKYYPVLEFLLASVLSGSPKENENRQKKNGDISNRAIIV